MPPKNSDPNKPKGRTSAYAFFISNRRAELKKQGKSIDFSEFAKKCSELWKSIDDEDKSVFVKKAEADKARYDKEMKEYSRQHAGAGAKKTRGGRRKKDPKAPKRPLSAFLFFSQDKRPQIKEENPAFTVGEVAKVLGQQWQATDSKKRTPYEALAVKDRKRYEDEKMNYNPHAEEEEEEDEDDYED